MKKPILVLLALILLLALFPAGTALAKAPLRCEITYQFVGAVDGQGRFIVWEGAITGDIEGTIRWWGGSAATIYTGQAGHYDAFWEIVDQDGSVVMAGEGSGTTTARHGKNSNWRTNDIVTVANGDYAEWLGRHVHESGHFTWTPDGVPYDGAGLFRVN